MIAFIGSVMGPHHNSPNEVADVWTSVSDAGVELRVFKGDEDAGRSERDGISKSLDPVAARNLAALLVRAADEAERMRARRQTGSQP